MEKMPTIFKRDFDSRGIISEQNPECDWVFSGDGVATRKFDGTCCLVKDGKLFKRYSTDKITVEKSGFPDGFVQADFDPVTFKIFGWVPVMDRPDERWHNEALKLSSVLEDGTYELIGPKIQGNPEHVSMHQFVRHGEWVFNPQPPRDFEGLKLFLSGQDIEGIVWHHPDGRMAKIKKRDFGMKRSE